MKKTLGKLELKPKGCSIQYLAFDKDEAELLVQLAEDESTVLFMARLASGKAVLGVGEIDGDDAFAIELSPKLAQKIASNLNEYAKLEPEIQKQRAARERDEAALNQIADMFEASGYRLERKRGPS